MTPYSLVCTFQTNPSLRLLKNSHIIYIYRESNLGSRTPRITNNSFYEQIFRTQSVSDDVLCLELRTRKPSKRRQKQITPDNFLVRLRPSGSEAESRGAKRQKNNPLPNNNISLPHHLPLTPSTLLHTGTVKLN